MFDWLSESWKHLNQRRAKRRFVALDLVKVLSVLWIIVAHSYNFAFQWLTFADQKVESIYMSPFTLWIGNSTFAVDNFFLISGLLTRKVARRDQESEEAITLRATLIRLVQRYSRLAPSLMLLIAVSVMSLPDTKVTAMFNGWCHSKWPLNALMTQNFIETQTMCFSHSWYVAVNFQLLTLIQVFDLVASCARVSDKCFRIVISIFILVAQLCVATQTYQNKLPALPLAPVEQPESMIEYYTVLYIKPHYWFASFLAGVLAGDGFMSNARGTRSRSFNYPRYIGLIAFGCMVAIILFPLPNFQQSSPMSPFVASLYAFFARPLWCLCLVILLRQVSVSCITKCPLWAPMSKLTYSLYLTHPVIMAIFYGSRTETFRFSHLLLAYLTVGHTFFSLLCALALFMTFESPITRLLLPLLTISKFKPQIDQSNASALRTGQKSRS